MAVKCRERAWQSFFIVVIVGFPVAYVVVTSLLVIQYDHCKALPGRYNYLAKFGLQLYSVLASVVLSIACTFLTRLTENMFHLGIHEGRRKARNRLLIPTACGFLLVVSSFCTMFSSVLVPPRSDEAKSTLKGYITEYGNKWSEIDSIQNYFSCCGVDGPKSWQLNIKFNCSSGNGVCGVPRSCCIDQTNVTCGFHVWENETLSSNIYEDGCLGSLEKCLRNSYIDTGLSFVVPTTICVYSYLYAELLFVLVKRRKIFLLVRYYSDSMVLVWKMLCCCCYYVRVRFQNTCTTTDTDEGNTCLRTGWRVVSGCCPWSSRQSFDSQSSAGSTEELSSTFLDATSLDANEEDSPVLVSNRDNEPLIILCTEDSRVPVEQPLEIDRLHRSSIAGQETMISEVEIPKSYLRLIQSELGLFDTVTTVDEVEKVVQTTAAESNQSSLSEEGSEVLPIGKLSLTVGPEGGSTHRGDLSLFVPAGAVDENVTLIAKLYMNEHKFPHVDISKEEFVFSPVLSLEPYGYQFKQPVLVRFPFSAVPGGWHLSLLRADCQVEQVKRTWKEIVTYNTDTGEVTTDDCQFDIDHALLGVSHFCDHCWCGKSAQGVSSVDRPLHRKILLCSVFGCQPNTNQNRWLLEVNLHDRCSDLYEEIVSQQERLSPPWKILGRYKDLIIGFDGDIRVEMTSQGSWRLTKDIEPQPFKFYWEDSFGNRGTINFAVELPPEPSSPDIHDIEIKVHGCDNTLAATFNIIFEETSVDSNHRGSLDRRTRAAGELRQFVAASSPTSLPPAMNHQSHVSMPEQPQASMLQSTGEYSASAGKKQQQMGTLLSSPLKENTDSVSAAKRLREHFGEVIDQLYAPYFVDELYAKDVFSKEDKEMLKYLKGKRLKQARKFMEIMETKGEKKIETFFHVLKATPEDKQPHLYGIFFPEAEHHERGSTTQTETIVKKILGIQEKRESRPAGQAPASSYVSKQKSVPSRQTEPRTRRSSSDSKGSSEEGSKPVDQPASIVYHSSHVSGPVVNGLQPSQRSNTFPTENTVGQAALCGDDEVGEHADGSGRSSNPMAFQASLENPGIGQGACRETLV